MTSKQSGGSQQSGGSGRGGSQQSQHSPKDTQSDSDKSQRGGSGNFANDHEKASEAGRKGGQHSHGGSSK